MTTFETRASREEPGSREPDAREDRITPDRPRLYWETYAGRPFLHSPPRAAAGIAEPVA
jgi:hypothetical protein